MRKHLKTAEKTLIGNGDGASAKREVGNDSQSENGSRGYAGPGSGREANEWQWKQRYEDE